jgi:hypothetical protein
LKISSRKAKGRDLQEEIGKKIAQLLDLEYGKDSDVCSREMGQSGSDIRLSPRAKEIFNFDIECKNHQKWNIPAAIKQIKSRCENNNWFLFFKRTSRKKDERIPTIAILDVELFFQLLENIYEKEKKV